MWLAMSGSSSLSDFPRKVSQISNRHWICSIFRQFGSLSRLFGSVLDEISPCLPTLGPIWAQYGQALQIPGQAYQGPFMLHLGQTPKRELAELHRRLDDAEHRFHRLLAQRIGLLAFAGLQGVFIRSTGPAPSGNGSGSLKRADQSGWWLSRPGAIRGVIPASRQASTLRSLK